MGALVALNLVFFLLLTFPGWAFPHQGGNDRLRVHMPTPVPESAALWATDVMATLDASALPPGDGPFDVYITDDTWRYDLYFAVVRGAGGVVYPIAGRQNFFLSGADFETDRLLKDGAPIPAPRTLSYYAVHEITHLTQIAGLGRLRYIRLPVAILEGVADYVALGPAGPELRQAVAAQREGDPRLPLMQAYGAYPEYRVLVSDRVERQDLWALMGAVAPD